MKVKEVFEKSVQFFKEKNIESSRLEAELLLAHVLKTDRVGIYLKYDAPLSEQEIKELRDLVMRRSKGQPSAYLTGEKYFFNRPFGVWSGVLIPRPETELMIEDIINNINLNIVSSGENDNLESESESESYNVADLGSGTGCLGLTLGLHFSDADVFLVERSTRAFQYLEKNFKNLIPEDKQNKFSLINKSVEEWLPSVSFNLIVANPPYIATNDSEIDPLVKKFEPEEALFAQDNGFSAIRSWLDFVVQYLKPGGTCYFEIGHRQGAEASELFSTTSIFEKIEVLKDYSQKDRFIKAIRK